MLGVSVFLSLINDDAENTQLTKNEENTQHKQFVENFTIHESES